MRAPAGVDASSVRGLAALVASGSPLRAALERWHELPEAAGAPVLSVVGRRLRLGASVAVALQPLRQTGPEGTALDGVLRLHATAGGNLVRMLESIAASLEQRADLTAASAAGAAGAKLSARLIAALPLVFVPLTATAGTPRFDAAGAALAVAGVLLALAGMAWLGRLVPVPPTRDDPVALVADLAAGALEGGIGIHAALDAIAPVSPPEIAPALQRAARVVALGASWPAALASCSDRSLAPLAALLERGRSTGVAPARALRDLAARRRAWCRTRFERSLRRAPVLMILPLTLCVLPSFGLLAVVPYVRGLAPGG